MGALICPACSLALNPASAHLDTDCCPQCKKDRRVDVPLLYESNQPLAELPAASRWRDACSSAHLSGEGERGTDAPG
jgi:hypothetical protein